MYYLEKLFARSECFAKSELLEKKNGTAVVRSRRHQLEACLSDVFRHEEVIWCLVYDIWICLSKTFVEF